jgi:hypothetical protein
MCLPHHLEYEVKPGSNVPQGLPRLFLPVLSPIWRGTALRLKYPDGEVHTLVGWAGPGDGGPAELRVFWTRHRPEAPAVCLAIGGDAGVRNFIPSEQGELVQGFPFLALAESVIPAAVWLVVGPPPAPAPLLLA